ncbi:hypothetical protein Acr_13g0004820 [Actinidia rufa]|uniref:LysM domain-containing protein n=1 Tax=Actinidia rufa TaxID=165716 RepID=A0A7J0FK50_9ERIC|nr:hypothetical protein Acr_13g0004820 [Actinidia rufa]
MAKANKRAAVFSNTILVLSVLLILISMAESRGILGIGFGKQATLVCNQVYGAQSGDSCFSVTQTFNLTSEFFNAINPNLVCNKIFVGQWLCVNGFVI